MPELMFQIPLWFNLVSGAVILVLGLANRKPHDLMALAAGVTELLLLVQLVVTIVLVAQGQHAKNDTVEFFIYVIVALLIPPAAVFWALVDRNSKWSTVVLGFSALSIAIMLVRMHQIWTGIYV
jgi:hypothetical protein